MDPAILTIGLEEEYQVVDPDSGALIGRAYDLLGDGGIGKREFQRTMLEADTPISGSASEARRHLLERRAELIERASREGLALAAGGLHPVGPYPVEQVTETLHYRQVAARGGLPMRELHAFGLHIHIGMPSREAAIRAMYGAARYIPHLLIPTSSSPFHRVRDTEYGSFRIALRDHSPRVGVPLPLGSVSEYDELERLLAGEDPDLSQGSPISWDIRPSPRFPTVEFRFFDATPWGATIELVTALARALAAIFADQPVPQLSGTELQLMRENRWRAARFGWDATFFRLNPVTGEERAALDSFLALVERLAPTIERLGDGSSLDLVDEVLARGNPAIVMREIFQRESSFPAVTRWVVEETRRG